MIGTLRIIRWTAFGLIAFIALGVAAWKLDPGGGVRRLMRPASENTVPGIIAVPPGTPIGGSFKLIDDKGRPVTDADYLERWMLVFFGYANCPDECPLTLQKMAAALGELGPLAGKVAPLFITVDPLHDTPDRLASYLENFDPRITGLTGTDEQIAAAAKAYRVYFSPVEHEESGADLVSHSTFLYLMDPAGTLDTLLRSDVDADKLAATLRAKLGVRP